MKHSNNSRCKCNSKPFRLIASSSQYTCPAFCAGHRLGSRGLVKMADATGYRETDSATGIITINPAALPPRSPAPPIIIGTPLVERDTRNESILFSLSLSRPLALYPSVAHMRLDLSLFSPFRSLPRVAQMAPANIRSAATQAALPAPLGNLFGEQVYKLERSCAAPRALLVRGTVYCARLARFLMPPFPFPVRPPPSASLGRRTAG